MRRARSSRARSARGCRAARSASVLPELLEARLDEPHLILVVVDREARRVAEPLRFAPQHASAGGVEREDPDRARRLAEHPLEALAHLPRRLVRERDREDLVRLHPARADQMRDAIRENARLPRARAGDHEQRALGRENGLALSFVEVGEVALGGRDGHRPMLAVAAEAAYQRTVSSTCAGILGPASTMLVHVMRQVYLPFGSRSYEPLQ